MVDNAPAEMMMGSRLSGQGGSGDRCMLINIVDSLFSSLCCGNDARSFAVEGQVLPFCQRCTGVYLGLAVTFVYLLGTRAYRRGLVGSPILVGIAACVGVMVVFGCHWVDPGRAWRFWSGLVFGNAVAWLLLPAAGVLWGGCDAKQRGHSAIGYFLLLGALSVLPVWFPFNIPGALAAVVALAVVGVAGVILCAAMVLAAVAGRIVRFIVKGVTNGYAST